MILLCRSCSAAHHTPISRTKILTFVKFGLKKYIYILQHFEFKSFACFFLCFYAIAFIINISSSLQLDLQLVQGWKAVHNSRGKTVVCPPQWTYSYFFWKLSLFKCLILINSLYVPRAWTYCCFFFRNTAEVQFSWTYFF